MKTYRIGDKVIKDQTLLIVEANNKWGHNQMQNVNVTKASDFQYDYKGFINSWSMNITFDYIRDLISDFDDEHYKNIGLFQTFSNLEILKYYYRLNKDFFAKGYNEYYLAEEVYQLMQDNGTCFKVQLNEGGYKNRFFHVDDLNKFFSYHNETSDYYRDSKFYIYATAFEFLQDYGNQLEGFLDGEKDHVLFEFLERKAD